MERKFSIILVFVFTLVICSNSCRDVEASIEDVKWFSDFSLDDIKLIWKEKHAAFTSLIKFDDRYFLAFRVGEKHKSSDQIENGYIRVLTSDDLSHWMAIDSLVYDGDLRDPFFSVTPQNKLLMLCGVNRIINGVFVHYKTVQTSFDKITGRFKEFSDIVMDDDMRPWLWKIRWNQDTAYGFAYQEGLTPLLMKSTDTRHWMKVCSLPIQVEMEPSEVDLAFISNNEMIVVVRNDKGHALVGRSKPPYSLWDIKSMGRWIGSPDLLVNSHFQVFLTYRFYGNGSVKKFTFSILDTLDLSVVNSLDVVEGENYDIGYGSSVFVEDGRSILTSYYVADEDAAGIYISKISTN